MSSIFKSFSHPIFLMVISLILTAFGQPFYISFFGLVTSACGYALFWKGILNFSTRTQRFWLALLWFALIQAIQLGWLTSDRYVGAYIFIIYILLAFGIGLEFGILSLFIKKNPSFLRCLALAGGWVILEWSRLFIMTGFSWSSIGLALTGHELALQFASVAGLFGLSFWVILTNGLALKVLGNLKKARYWILWGTFTIIPYFYGFTYIYLHKNDEHASIQAILVQTALAPEQKIAFSGQQASVLHPVEQWKHILFLLQPHVKKTIDLIVLSEAVVPYGTDLELYKRQHITDAFKKVFRINHEEYLPDWPYYLGNSFWAQSLSNFFQAPVLIGLEDITHQHNFNAAFLFQPKNSLRQRYEKRILVPMGEYIPFTWCKKILKKYGIVDSFTAGLEAKVLSSPNLHLGVSICYEETYGHLMRQNRLKGADLLVNVTNDVWYPQSQLPLVHFYHGRLRAVENGIPLVRACNTGMTCAVDAHGRLIAALDSENWQNRAKPGALAVKIPLNHLNTLYTKVGDSLIVCSSFLFVLIGVLFRKEI